MFFMQRANSFARCLFLPTWRNAGPMRVRSRTRRGEGESEPLLARFSRGRFTWPLPVETITPGGFVSAHPGVRGTGECFRRCQVSPRTPRTRRQCLLPSGGYCRNDRAHRRTKRRVGCRSRISIETGAAFLAPRHQRHRGRHKFERLPHSRDKATKLYGRETGVIRGPSYTENLGQPSTTSLPVKER